MMNMVQYNFLSEAEVNELVQSAGAVGFVIGMFIGFAIFLFFIYMMNNRYRRNFKMWFLELPEKEREKVKVRIDEVGDTIEELAKSNTRLFKKIHNELCEIKSFLRKKWMQS